ncbi:hypothetical protein [Stakelama flava]|nr:hypothetical protein [Stakelama flava]
MQRLTLTGSDVVDLPVPIALSGAIADGVMGDSILEIIVAVATA